MKEEKKPKVIIIISNKLKLLHDTDTEIYVHRFLLALYFFISYFFFVLLLLLLFLKTFFLINER